MRNNPLPRNLVQSMMSKPKKITFFGYLLPQLQQSYKKIGQKRAKFLAIKTRRGNNRSLTANQTETIRLLEKYRVTEDEPLSAKTMTLRERGIDAIPEALAQAANESGWGASRFAVKGNNYFGLC